MRKLGVQPSEANQMPYPEYFLELLGQIEPRQEVNSEEEMLAEMQARGWA